MQLAAVGRDVGAFFLVSDADTHSLYLRKWRYDVTVPWPLRFRAHLIPLVGGICLLKRKCVSQKITWVSSLWGRKSGDRDGRRTLTDMQAQRTEVRHNVDIAARCVVIRSTCLFERMNTLHAAITTAHTWPGPLLAVRREVLSIHLTLELDKLRWPHPPLFCRLRWSSDAAPAQR